jgi:hypothetical protein
MEFCNILLQIPVQHKYALTGQRKHCLNVLEILSSMCVRPHDANDLADIAEMKMYMPYSNSGVGYATSKTTLLLFRIHYFPKSYNETSLK